MGLARPRPPPPPFGAGRAQPRSVDRLIPACGGGLPPLPRPRVLPQNPSRRIRNLPRGPRHRLLIAACASGPRFWNPFRACLFQGIPRSTARGRIQTSHFKAVLPHTIGNHPAFDTSHETLKTSHDRAWRSLSKKGVRANFRGQREFLQERIYSFDRIKRLGNPPPPTPNRQRCPERKRRVFQAPFPRHRSIGAPLPGRLVTRASWPARGTSPSPCWCGSGVGYGYTNE